MDGINLGRAGVWTGNLEGLPAREAQRVAAELEGLGYAALWIPESVGREAFANAGLLLAATSRLTIATGIASIWARDAVAMANGQRTLAEAYPRRFLLGMGVSHAPLVESVRGHQYRRPLSVMRDYLDRMDAAPYRAVMPSEPPVRVLAALRPKMLALARERAGGAHPYFVPVEHTVEARRILGEGPLLLPEQAVLLESDPERARAGAREHMAGYLRLPNYVNNLLHLGYTEADVADGGSDRLVDAIVAWGDLDAVAGRVRAHLDAGADHVCIQVLGAARGSVPMAQWRALAAVLTAL